MFIWGVSLVSVMYNFLITILILYYDKVAENLLFHIIK